MVKYSKMHQKEHWINNKLLCLSINGARGWESLPLGALESLLRWKFPAASRDGGFTQLHPGSSYPSLKDNWVQDRERCQPVLQPPGQWEKEFKLLHLCIVTCWIPEQLICSYRITWTQFCNSFPPNEVLKRIYSYYYYFRNGFKKNMQDLEQHKNSHF